MFNSTNLIFYIGIISCIVPGYPQASLKIAGEMPPDHFLLKTIQAMPDDEKASLSPDYYALLVKLRDRVQAYANGGMITAEILHEELSAEEALDIFGPCLESEDIADDPVIRTVFDLSFSPQFYFIRRSEKAAADPENYFNTAELEEIYLTASRILAKTCPGDVLISLGQSPAYLIEALAEMSSSQKQDDDYRIIYKIPFSGAPDFCTLNRHYKTYKLSNLTTKASLDYYKMALQQLGFDPFLIPRNSKVYVIDLIGTGGSTAAFLKILINWHTALGLPLPEITLLDISVENRNFKEEMQIQLPLSPECQLVVDRVFVHTTPHLSDKLDYTEGEDRIQPPFGALQWKPAYEPIFAQYPNRYAREVSHAVRKHARERNRKPFEEYSKTNF